RPSGRAGTDGGPWGWITTRIESANARGPAPARAGPCLARLCRGEETSMSIPVTQQARQRSPHKAAVDAPEPDGSPGPPSGVFVRPADPGLGALGPGPRRALVEGADWVSLEGEPCLPLDLAESIITLGIRGGAE